MYTKMGTMWWQSDIGVLNILTLGKPLMVLQLLKVLTKPNCGYSHGMPCISQYSPWGCVVSLPLLLIISHLKIQYALNKTF